MSNQFKNWTQAEVDAFNAKHRRSDPETIVHAANQADKGRESDLHDKIMAACRLRGWICFHDRMDKPTTGTQGRPDFVILAHGGIVHFIECKADRGKLSPAQQGLVHHAERLGTKIHVVRSMSQFYDVVKA